MRPHDVLGIQPTASIEEAEAAYRRLLHAHHPDRFVDGSSEQLAAAEARTRDLNEAIARLRAARSRASEGVWAGHSGTGWGEAPDHEELGHACGLCGQWFETRVALQEHVTYDHRVRGGGRGRPAAKPLQVLDWLVQPTVIWAVAGGLLLVLWVSSVHCSGAECGRTSDSARVLAGVLAVWWIVLPLVYWHYLDR